MSESTSGGSSGWAFPGAQALPGLSPRPQHHVVGKKGGKEMIDSTSKALFVFVKNCDDMEVEVNGKVGKVTIENGKSLRILVNDHVVSGTLELIRCQNVALVYGKDAEIPIIQVDNSSTITINIKEKAQIQNVYFIRTADIKVIVDQNETDALQYDLSPENEAESQKQRIAYWSEVSPDAHFIHEAVVRDHVYPTTAQMKKAADEKKAQTVGKMAQMLLGGITIHKKGDDKKLNDVD